MRGTAVLGLGLTFSLGLIGCSSDNPAAPDAGGFDNPIGGGAGSSGKGGAGEGSAGSAGKNTGPLGGCLDCEVCKHIDMIISVDGSSSMTEELRAIRDEVFPAFADRLLSISGGIDDFRVGTLDACPSPANYHTRGNAGECNFEGGSPWIDSASTNMRDEFQCVGDIYQDDATGCTHDNDDEQPASAAAKSLETEFATGANMGFSRANSLLVVVAITDEDEQPTSSARSPQQVYERLVAAKGGDSSRIVFLGIGGGSNCNGIYGTALEAIEMKAIVDLFKANGHGVFWDLCNGKLEDGLEEAYNVIEAACNDLPPPPTEQPPFSDGPD